MSAAAECEALGLRLAEFLDRISLASDADQLEEASQLSLMTIHCAKGLEFPVVFIAGMDEGIFPHNRALLDPRELEEERRLAYVGITRAEANAHLEALRVQGRCHRRGGGSQWMRGKAAPWVDRGMAAV